MTSLVLNFFAGMRGRVKGTTANSGLQSALGGVSTFAVNISSALTGASQGNQAFGPTSRTLTGGASEELDTQSFTNTLGETAQAIAEIRLLYIKHSTASLAASITVGNATADQFRFFNAAVTTTFTLLPGEFVIFGAPTATAMPASGTLQYIKVLNNSGALVATYEIGWFGSTS